MSRSTAPAANGGLSVDATFYDSEAFTQPLHIVTPWNRTAGIEDAQHRFTYVDRPSPQKGPPWAHNSLGASVHTALRSWFDQPTARRHDQEHAGVQQDGGERVAQVV